MFTLFTWSSPISSGGLTRTLSRRSSRCEVQAHPIPVGVISGWKLQEEEVRQRGFACLVRKPFDLEALLTSIAACLQIPLTPEQARQAPVVQAYFAALSARAWDALLALCTDEVLYSLPDSPFAGTIRGKAAFRTYTEETFRQFPAARFEEVLVSSRPHGLAARYRSCWATPEGGRRVRGWRGGLWVSGRADRPDWDPAG